MGKLSDSDEGGEFPRLSDVNESDEAALHTTQINLAPEAFERFSDVFEDAVRRWERIVYPAMFVMVLVMAYGFFLIFKLGSDMRIIALKIEPIAGHMEILSKNMGQLTGSIHDMNQGMKVIAKAMPEMNDKLSSMLVISRQMTIMNERMGVMNAHMEGMNQQMFVMNSKMYQMTGNISEMNRSVSGPANFMRKWAPVPW